MGENRKIAIKFLFLFLLSFSSCNPALANKEIQADSIRITNEGFQRFYENTSNGSNYVELKSNASLSGNVSFVLPTADGTSGQYLKTDGSGNLSFDSVSSSGTLNVSTKTANYTVTTSDNVLLADTSGGAFTFTLPTAVGNSGVKFTFIKITGDTNNVAISPDGSETADGSSDLYLRNREDSITLISNGTNWFSIENSTYNIRYARNGTRGSFFTRFGVFINTQCSASPCSITWQYGDAVTSVTRAGTGTYDVNIDTSVFDAPNSLFGCQATSMNNSSVDLCKWNPNTSSSIRVTCYRYDTGAAIDARISLVCDHTLN